MIAAKSSHESIIEAWMLANVQGRSYLRFDDLHIDVIDSAYKRSENWIAGSVRCMDLAIEVRNRHQLSFTVALGMSLRAGGARLGLNFEGFQQVLSECDSSPPSLYIFPAGEHDWLGHGESTELDPKYAAPTKFATRPFLREWYDENDKEYRRTFWSVG